MTKQLVTNILWRMYPEQKPPRSGAVCLVLTSKGIVHESKWRKWRNGKGWWNGRAAQAKVTHFALPEDITTTEQP